MLKRWKSARERAAAAAAAGNALTCPGCARPRLAASLQVWRGGKAPGECVSQRKLQALSPSPAVAGTLGTVSIL